MKLLVHAIPHQSALWAASFPPGEAKGGHCVFAQGFLKLRVPTATPQPLRRQLPFQGHLGVCPYTR